MCAAPIASGRFRPFRLRVQHAAGDFYPRLPFETDPGVDIMQPNDRVRTTIVSLHGTGGDAVQYHQRAVDAIAAGPLLANQTLAFAPQFFNNNADEVSGSFDRRLIYWQGGRASGGHSATNAANPRTFFVRSYHVMDQVLEHLTRKDLFPNLRMLVLMGHSNGGQFIARYAAINRFEERFANDRGVHVRYIPMNPGTYPYLTPRRFRFSSTSNYQSSATVDESWVDEIEEITNPASGCAGYNRWGFGLEGLAGSRADDQSHEQIIEKFRRRDVVYMVGGNDTSSSGYSGAGFCAQARQGANHLSAALLHYHSLRTVVYSGRSMSHKLVVVPGVGHNGRAVMLSPEGLREIFRNPPSTQHEEDNMPMKVLSGIIVPDRPVGTVTVQFNPHRITGDGHGSKLEEAGDRGDYTGTPAVNVSLRQIKVGRDRDDYTFKVDDTNRTRDGVEIGWAYKTQSPIQELSYVIAGNVAD